MKKSLKLLCGLAALLLLTGFSKKSEAAATAVETVEHVTNKGIITTLGTYKGVEVTRLSTEVTHEELNKKIQNILDSFPSYHKVIDRPARHGDEVTIDYFGMMDGKELEGGTAKGFRLKLGSGLFIDGFEDGLIGANTGDKLSLNLKFPDNYPLTNLAGKAVVFEVTVNQIEEVTEAVLDNNFVQEISDFETVDEWKAEILAEMKAEKVSQAKTQLTNDAFLKAVENSEYELNEAAIDETYHILLDYYNSNRQMYGLSMADYVSLLGMTEEQFINQLRKDSILVIKKQLLVEAIAMKEGLIVEDADLEPLAAQLDMSVEELRTHLGTEALEESAMLYKVIALIEDHAVVI